MLLASERENVQGSSLLINKYLDQLIILLVAGVLLVLWAWGSFVLRTSDDSPDVAPSEVRTVEDHTETEPQPSD